MKIINLTPHTITIHGDGGAVTLLPGGPAPRLAVTRQPVGSVTLDGVTLHLVRPTLGATEGLPAAEDGTLLIVSALVAEANKHRSDLASPGELLRDAAGVITGCRGLCVFNTGGSI